MGNLILDQANLRAYRSGETLELLPQEFTILWILASRPGRTLSREYLLHRIRTEFPNFGESSLKQYVSALKRKIGENYIRFVRGMGYQFGPMI